MLLCKKGETLYDVAQNNGVQFDKILEYNNLIDGSDGLAGKQDFPEAGKKDIAYHACRLSSVNELSAKIQRYNQRKAYIQSQKNMMFLWHEMKDWNGLTVIIRSGSN